VSTTAIPRGHRLSLLADNRRPDRTPPRRGPVMPDTTSAAALQIPAVGTYQLDPVLTA